eukprot:CAMPEP_0174712588 /NCGR_PEP_ID=MMETSP1094-20130205/13539_1 /TAXON_ID=156173 /ORGANISM="Chrysochromulina brevifilum, Strain UTEX LB 985" /LENGTH=104 /DNA_ID=CAMNT_0015911671 /DNA_START=106 /DNA_END=417 /DNA_ORIENTATION=-
MRTSTSSACVSCEIPRPRSRGWYTSVVGKSSQLMSSSSLKVGIRWAASSALLLREPFVPCDVAPRGEGDDEPIDRGGGSGKLGRAGFAGADGVSSGARVPAAVG